MSFAPVTIMEANEHEDNQVPKSQSDDDESQMSAFTPVSFDHFMDLPRDIRYMIYDILLPGPRIIHIAIEEMKLGTVERVWNNQDIEQENSFFDPYSLREKHVRIGRKIPQDYGPHPLYAVRATSPPISGLFFAFREPYEVFCKTYSRTYFSLVGAKLSVWFSSKLDTMYIDCRTYGFSCNSRPGSSSVLTADFGADVKRLALGNTWRGSLFSSFRAEYDTFRRHAWISTVISWFPNLEHVFLEAGDTWDPFDKYYDFAFVEPSNNIAFNIDYTPMIDRKIGAKLESLRAISREMMQKDLSELFKASQWKTGKSTLLKIEHKLFLNSRSKAEFEGRIRRYHESKSRYRHDVHLTSPDMANPQEYKVSPTTTVEHLLDQFRSSRGLSSDVRLMLRRGTTVFQPDSLVLQINGIETAGIFTVDVM